MSGADCQRWRMLLDDHLSGELLVETTQELLRHIDGCRACRQELAARQELRLALARRLSIDEVPSSLEQDVSRALAGQASGDPDGSELRRSRFRWTLGRMMAIAAGLSLMIWVGGAPAFAAIRAALGSLGLMLSAPVAPPPLPPVTLPRPKPPPAITAPDWMKAPAASVVSHPTPVNFVDLQLEALWRLHQAGALIEEEISISRDARALSIRARVETPGRKATLERALAPVAAAGARVRVQTFAESASGGRVSQTSPRVILQEVGAVVERSAASDLLTAHFAKQLGADGAAAVGPAVREFSTRTLHGSRQITLHAFALKRLAEHVPASALEDASDVSRVTYQVLVREYAGATEAAASVLLRDLGSVFGSGGSADVSDVSTPSSIEALATRANELERALDATFAVQAGVMDPPPLDGERLLSLARSVERLASDIRRSASK